MFNKISNPILDAVRQVFDTQPPYQQQRIYEDLLRAYSGPTRHYHTQLHITEMLEKAKTFDLKNKKAFMAAILYHDYIYEAQRYSSAWEGLSNEEKSAQICSGILMRARLQDDVIVRARELIVMTEKHNAPESDDEARLFMDIDMSIIGAPHRRFAEYAAANAREYLHAFTPEQYLQGRAAFLTHALEKSPIFKTAHFAYLEDQAKQNIEWELKHLGQIVFAASASNTLAAHKPDYK